jgi:hypothetical protein
MLVTISYTASAEDTMTVESAQEFIDLIDEASRKRDVTFIRDSISENAVFKLKTNLSGRFQETELSKTEYIDNLLEGWPYITNETHKRLSLDVEIKDGFAYFEEKAMESAMVRNRIFVSGTTDSTYKLKRVNGRYLIVEYSSVFIKQ